MRPASGARVDQLDFSDEARKIIKAAFNDTNPKSALEKMTKLFQEGTIMRCEVAKYSPKTGKPVRYEWRPYGKWDGELWFNWTCGPLCLDKNSPLFGALMNYLPLGKTRILVANNKQYVVTHAIGERESANHIEFCEPLT